MQKQFIPVVLISILTVGCMAYKNNTANSNLSFYKIGHRGTRGYEPENTIPSMKKAWDIGANTVEFDVWLSKDDKVVVNHDASVNANYNSLPGKTTPDKADIGKYIIRQNNYEDLRKVIVGGKPYKSFPKQSSQPSYMPLLPELVDSMEAYTNHKILYLLEIKTDPKKEGITQPDPETYMTKLMKGFDYKKLGDRLIIQSFDPSVLKVLHRTHPEIRLGFLLSNKDGFQGNLDKLGFIPAFYNPEQKLVDKELVEQCHAKGIKIAPWTVNTSEDVAQLKSYGVDGVITDYADLL